MTRTFKKYRREDPSTLSATILAVTDHADDPKLSADRTLTPGGNAVRNLVSGILGTLEILQKKKGVTNR